MTPIASSKQPRNPRASCRGERGMQGGGSGIAVIVLAQVRQRSPRRNRTLCAFQSCRNNPTIRRTRATSVR